MANASLQIGNYIVGDLLGKGGYSWVYAGMHRETGQTFALKLLDKENVSSSSSVSKQVKKID